jgi:hypothetical protein
LPRGRYFLIMFISSCFPPFIPTKNNHFVSTNGHINNSNFIIL